MRRFDFEIGGPGQEKQTLGVELHDTPMQTGKDHTDVGLQTWGASIVISRFMAMRPEAFGLGDLEPGTTIVELGAGTGLLSLVLSSLLAERQPLIVATDYHPTVLTNLRRNAATHAESNPGAAPIEVCHLDWSAPSREAPLDTPAKYIVAADVAYAPEHAAWLRDCGAHLLAADGVFWLMVSIRPNGKFEGISDVVEAAFEAGRPGVDGRVLKIVSTERIHKLDGIGRADEVAYKLYKVMWQGP
ncbi:Protein-lysine methyltransferase METTL21E [Escovopsis weberi]|uniref:Protein-lysine methyltransferase METTL21E n=1 Tax=Escovopsis weberi TaxID=150374 RepID=A0A0M8N6J2_ESCWE|nr:Protein-lysine methyltransferase METTL21E [Escovopsis weberi]